VDSYDLDQHEEDLTLLLHAWPDIEEAILKKLDEDAYAKDEWRHLADSLRQALRIEVQEHAGGLRYVALFDVNSYEARQSAAYLQENKSRVNSLASRHAPTQGQHWGIEVRVVPGGKPIEGEVCPRVMAPAPGFAELLDLPEPEPPASTVPYEVRGLHKLTPIEAPFYAEAKLDGPRVEALSDALLALSAFTLSVYVHLLDGDIGEALALPTAEVVTEPALAQIEG
jgi:hypothetical protein